MAFQKLIRAVQQHDVPKARTLLSRCDLRDADLLPICKVGCRIRPPMRDMLLEDPVFREQVLTNRWLLNAMIDWPDMFQHLLRSGLVRRMHPSYLRAVWPMRQCTDLRDDILDQAVRDYWSWHADATDDPMAKKRIKQLMEALRDLLESATETEDIRTVQAIHRHFWFLPDLVTDRMFSFTLPHSLEWNLAIFPCIRDPLPPHTRDRLAAEMKQDARRIRTCRRALRRQRREPTINHPAKRPRA